MIDLRSKLLQVLHSSCQTFPWEIEANEELLNRPFGEISIIYCFLLNSLVTLLGTAQAEVLWGLWVFCLIEMQAH